MDKSRQLLWDWIEYRNKRPNTDLAGLMALSKKEVKNLLNIEKKDNCWNNFYNKWGK